MTKIANVSTAATKSASSSATTKPIVKAVANRDYLPQLMQMLDSAKKSIDIVEYNFYSESGDAKSIADKLVALKKANPKLAIRIFIEGDHGDGAARNLATVKTLQAAGIQVQLDSKNLITHAKGVCVDGSQVLAGSTNMTNTSMDDNNEVSLAVNSAALGKAYESYFNALMKDPTSLQTGSTQVGNTTLLTDAAYEPALLTTIRSAKKTLDASMYDLNFDGKDAKAQEVVDELVKAAKRGVKVKLMLEQDSSGFAPQITEANEKAFAYLKANGVDVHLDSPTQISHQKFIVGDGKDVLLGSTNWTESDFDQRHQLNWHVKDAALGKQLQALLASEIGP
jgi:phosphatidylserine/phosphatidylglycerophosphate/cardiolipin synthase-like enzyme